MIGAWCGRVRFFALASLLLVGAATSGKSAEPVSLSFRVPDNDRESFAREIWADVVTPSQTALRLPAFFAGDHRFEVRARATEPGTYRVRRVTERMGDVEAVLPITDDASQTVSSNQVATRSAVGIVGDAPGRFAFGDGRTYLPLGMNLAWAPGGSVNWYKDAFDQLSAARLNWTRIWMAHWGGLNLDWLPATQKSPRPGLLDASVAAKWDALIAHAEERGIYVQLVLQHHGQYSSRVNPNWNANPWNAANPQGFLHSPAEFFTSSKARQLTKQKFRYIVARWGYSPAVLAWELFNEVHWVDAIRMGHDEEAVAKWHDEMAAYVRSVDVYGHLVTTSTDDLHSAIYRSMDYLQPHLYATNMLAAARRFEVPPETLKRPIFYGEMGDDHMRITDAQKVAAVELGPIVWASLMGQGGLPAQIWEGQKMLEQGRVNEVGAVARFVAATQMTERANLQAFSAVVESSSTAPLRLEGAENWHKRRPTEIVFAMDGRELPQYGVVPSILVGSPRSVDDGFPNRISLVVDYPMSATASLRIADAGMLGAQVRIAVDGATVADHTWPAARQPDGRAAAPRPASLSFPVAAGRHKLVIDNPGGLDWVDFESLDFGLQTSALAAIGRRNPDFVALWLWQRDGVFEIKTPRPVSGTVVIEDVARGRWKAIWWDTQRGVPARAVEFEHPGGTLRLASPPVARHAALVLTR